MKQTHWKKLTNPNYLGSWDVDPEQGSLEIKIVSVQKELVTGVGGEKEECVVAQIENQKPMILNKTNCKTIEKIFDSPYIETWKDKKITIIVEKVKAFGQVVDALRVKPIKVDQREKLSPSSKRWQGAIDALKEGKCDMAYIDKKFLVSKEDKVVLQEAINA